MVIGIIIVCGVFGNLAVIITVFKEPKLRQLQHYVLIACLAISDCAFNALIMPFYVESWWYNYERHSQSLCYYYNYLGTILLQTSGTIIVFIAFNRYLLVAHLRLFKKFENYKVTLLQMLVATILAVVMVAPSFNAIDTSIIYMPQLGRCNWDRVGARTVVYAVFTNFVIAPFAVIVTLYILVLVHLRKSQNAASKDAQLEYQDSSNKMETLFHKSISIKAGHHQSVDSVQTENNIVSEMTAGNKVTPVPTDDHITHNKEKKPSSDNQSKEYQRRLRGYKSFMPIIAVFIVYLVTYIPFTVINMMDKDFSLHRNYYMISSLLFWSSSCLNPWIYGIMNKELNSALKAGMSGMLDRVRQVCPCERKREEPGDAVDMEMHSSSVI